MRRAAIFLVALFVTSLASAASAEPKPGEIGTLIGSSAGSVFAALVAAGYDVPSIVNSFIGRKSPLPRITDKTIFKKRGAGFRGYFRRVRNAVNLRAGAELFPGSGIGPDEEESNGDPKINPDYKLTMQKLLRHFRVSDLLVLRSRYVLHGMEQWFRDLLGDHDSFEAMRTNLFILASDLDQPMTAVFGREQKECVWYQYVAGVKPSRAAAHPWRSRRSSIRWRSRLAAASAISSMATSTTRPRQ